MTFSRSQSTNNEFSGYNPHSTTIQTQLEVGAPNDKYEQEANNVADMVMKNSEADMVQMMGNEEEEDSIQMMGNEEEEESIQMQPESSLPSIQCSAGTPGIQCSCAGCNSDEEKLRKKSATQGSEYGTSMASPEITNQIQSSKGGGKQLSKKTQQELGSKMGADFSDVRVHTDDGAIQMNQELGAKAFTSGKDIYFNEGNYNPESADGKHLLAHELTHTMQQSGATDVVQRAAEVEDKWEERELASGEWFTNLADEIIADYSVTTMNRYEIAEVIRIKNNVGKKENGETETYYPGTYIVPGEAYFDGHGFQLTPSPEDTDCATGTAPTPELTLTVNPTYLDGGSNSTRFTTDLAHANDVYEQAGIKLEEGNAETINEEDTKKILGDDKTLDDNTTAQISKYTDEEKNLMVVNQEQGSVTVFYLDDVDNSSIYGRAFIESDSVVMTSDENTRSFAHEIGHLLVGAWHSSSDDNIMAPSTTADGTDCITDQQIEMMRNSHLT